MLQFNGASSFGADPNRHARRIFAWDVSKVYCDPNNLGCSPMDGMFGGTALRNDECSKALIFEAWRDAGAPTPSAFMNAYGGDRLGDSEEYEDWSGAVCKAFEVEECSAERSEHNGEIADTLGDGNPATCCTVDMGDGTFDPPSSASYGKVVAPPYYRYFMAPGGENCPAGTMITTHDECRVAAAALGRPHPALGRGARPGGCFWDKNENGYFNSDLEGEPDWDGVGGLCREPYAAPSGVRDHYPGGQCVQSPNYPNPYPATSSCSIRATFGDGITSALAFEYFETSPGDDYIEINGVRYSGESGAATGSYPGSNVLMTDGESFTWSASGGSPNVPGSDCDRGAYGEDRGAYDGENGACSGPVGQPTSFRAWKVCLNNKMWAALTGDPHLTGAHGDHADVKGADGGIYSLLSAPRLSVAVRFEHDDFKTPYSKQLIHGSWVRAAFWVVRLRAPNPAVVRVAYELSKMNLNHAHASVVVLDGTSNNASQLSHLRLEVGGETFSRGELFVGLSQRILTVRTAAWLTTAKGTNLHPHWGVKRMDVQVKTRSRAALRPVAPHGLLGQTFDDDGVPLHGARDDYTKATSGKLEHTTRAAGEGAIEGTIEEYRLPSPFATEFKYSRFGRRISAPRNATALRWAQIHAALAAEGKVAAAAATGGKVQLHLNYQGFDLRRRKRYHSPTPESCYEACRKTRGCAAYSYILESAAKPWQQRRNGERYACFLKKKGFAAGAGYSKGTASGVLAKGDQLWH